LKKLLIKKLGTFIGKHSIIILTRYYITNKTSAIKKI